MIIKEDFLNKIRQVFNLNIYEVTDGSWIHPGITARHFAWEVERYIEEQAPKLINRIVSEMFGK